MIGHPLSTGHSASGRQGLLDDAPAVIHAQLAGYQQLANVVILVSFPIAGCSLAVSVVAGLNDRKRPFSMLRLTGVQLGTLRRVVALETVVPLFVVAVVAMVQKRAVWGEVLARPIGVALLGGGAVVAVSHVVR